MGTEIGRFLRRLRLPRHSHSSESAEKMENAAEEGGHKHCELFYPLAVGKTNVLYAGLRLMH